MEFRRLRKERHPKRNRELKIKLTESNLHKLISISGGRTFDELFEDMIIQYCSI